MLVTRRKKYAAKCHPILCRALGQGETSPKTQRRILVLLICSIVGFLMLAVFVHRARTGAPEIFRSVVIDPIPKSVKNIRVHRHQDSGGWFNSIRIHQYVLRFDISQEDLAHILASRSFTKLEDLEYTALRDLEDVELGNLEYPRGHVSYAIPYGYYVGLSLHMTKQEEAWFDVSQWRNGKSSIVEDDDEGYSYKGHFLLYNERLRRAYFIEREERGSGAGGRSVTSAEAHKYAESMKRQMDQFRERREDPNVQRARERLHERRKDANALEGIQER